MKDLKVTFVLHFKNADALVEDRTLSKMEMFGSRDELEAFKKAEKSYGREVVGVVTPMRFENGGFVRCGLPETVGNFVIGRDGDYF